jgi:hypothetical protein
MVKPHGYAELDHRPLTESVAWVSDEAVVATLLSATPAIQAREGVPA